MAFDAFLKMGIKGDSQAKGHPGEVEVRSFKWGMSQSTTSHHSGSGFGAGRVNVDKLTIDKYIDSASATLADGCCRGKHYPEAILTVQKAGGEPLPYLTFTMKDVFITSYQINGAGGDDLVTESIELVFGSFKESFQPQDSKGGKQGGAIEVEYSIVQNA